MAALNRQIDDIILAAARGNARSNSGLVALPSTQKIAVGGASLTLAKLLTAKEILDGNEVDDDASLAGRRPGRRRRARHRGQRQDADEPVRHDRNQVGRLQQREGAGAGHDRHVPGLQVRAHRARGQGRHRHHRLRDGVVQELRGAGHRPGDQHLRRPPPGQEQRLAGLRRHVIGATRLEDEGVVEIACA
jgi:hypothetical protein